MLEGFVPGFVLITKIFILRNRRPASPYEVIYVKTTIDEFR